MKIKMDLVCISPLNIDFIATKKKLVTAATNSVASEISSRFEFGTENAVDDNDILDIISQIGKDSFEVYFRGSAFNTLHTVITTNPSFATGIVGIAGNTGLPGYNFLKFLGDLNVDTRFVGDYTAYAAARCISFINEGERTLLTSQGINRSAHEYMSTNHEAISEYLAAARIVHVSSFFDEASRKELLRVLMKAKSINPLMKISFDPGNYLIQNLSKETAETIEIADFLFLNDREFELLGHRRTLSDDLLAARRILTSYNKQYNKLLVILKRYDEIKLFSSFQGKILQRSVKNNYLPLEVIEDTTGAGDVFAGGFLTAQLLPWIDLKDAVELGLDLVKSKIVHSGSKEFMRNREIFKRFTERLLVPSSESFFDEKNCSAG